MTPPSTPLRSASTLFSGFAEEIQIFPQRTQVEPLFCEWIKHNVPQWEDAVVVSPDEGAVKKSVSVANDLNLDFALIHNRCKPTGVPRVAGGRASTRTAPNPNDLSPPENGNTLSPDYQPQSDGKT